MLKSMTGFGRSKYENDSREYAVEIKSVNNRYSDISIKMPRTISYLEDKVRKQVLASVTRGKIDVFISMQDFSEKGKEIKLNRELAKAYIEELKQLAEETGIELREFSTAHNVTADERESGCDKQYEGLAVSIGRFEEAADKNDVECSKYQQHKRQKDEVGGHQRVGHICACIG